MLITTGKDPDAASRAIARAFSSVFPNSQFEGRGKRSLPSLIEKARRQKMSRICTIYKQEGGKHAISFLLLTECGFEWLSPRILVSKIEQHSSLPKKSATRASSLKLTGTKAKALQELTGAISSPEADSSVAASQASLSLSLNGKKLLSLGVSYEK